MPEKRKGTYVLLFTFLSDRSLSVGALGTLDVPKGRYCYVGSAMNGIDHRVSRHISKDKRMRWHIDYLTVLADSVEAFVSYPDFIPECDLASLAGRSGCTPVFHGFGCSDCRCATHLFRADGDSASRLVADAGLIPFEDRSLSGHSEAC